ncbi:Uma2 family endonuclease, partial [Geitlerinema sp. P-1104]
RLPIYAALGVPEIWLYRQERLEILRQVGGGYEPQGSSLAFPMVTVVQLNQWLALRQTGTDLTVIRAVRQFCREVGD